jgi:hypothetical protein
MKPDVLIKKFQKYHNNPVRYVEQVLDFKTLDPGQCDILDAIARYDRVGVKSGNGWGKSLTLAAASLWFFDTRYMAKVPTTSGSFRQVKRSLWSELHRLARQSKLKGSYNILQTDLERVGYEAEWFITGFSTEQPCQAEGWHAKNLMYVLDEARAIEDEIFQAAFKACTTPGSKILCGSIPGDENGMFYKIFTQLRKTWKCFSFPTAAFKHRKYKALYPDRVSQTSIDEKAAEGPSSPFFQTSVLANFANTSADTIIPLDFFLKAREKPKKTEIDLQQQPQQSTVWGADIARYGADKTCLCKRQGDTILLFKQRHGMSIMDSATWIALECKKDTVCIDEIGVGAGTYDKLDADGFNVVGVNVARAPRDTERFANKRAELFWELREKFEKSEIDLSQLDRKTCDQLQHQITSIRYKFARGKLLVESKEDMKKRGLPSPDMADALVLSYAADAFNVTSNIEIKAFASKAVDYDYWYHGYD